jgi:tocopherol cyclase
MKLFRPEVFQGSLRKRRYFEGWYFKHVSQDAANVYAFIPGISLTPDDSHAFIQIINGTTGATHYVPYDLKEFNWSTEKLYVRIGDSIFTDKYIDLNINGDGIAVNGKVEYTGVVRYPRTLFAPGIMGWYSYVPFMECSHGIVSVNHGLHGGLIINNQETGFDGGKGYIEKDWGRSFPEAWIWLQCNVFSVPERSVHVSIAKIPWLGGHFTGFIAFVFDRGSFYLFSTYNGSKISSISHDQRRIEIELKSRTHSVSLTATKSRTGELKAPVSGTMSRRIKESIDSEVTVKLSNSSGTVLFEDAGKRAGLEIIEKIFGYL